MTNDINLLEEVSKYLDNISSDEKLKELKEEIGAYAVETIQKRMKENRVIGKPLDSRTINRKGNDIKLVDEGNLLGSVDYDVTKDGVVIGTHLTYGKFHQLGMGVPKREWLVIDNSELEFLKEIVNEVLTND
jgi:phage gpG-like protein